MNYAYTITTIITGPEYRIQLFQQKVLRQGNVVFDEFFPLPKEVLNSRYEKTFPYREFYRVDGDLMRERFSQEEYFRFTEEMSYFFGTWLSSKIEYRPQIGEIWRKVREKEPVVCWGILKLCGLPHWSPGMLQHWGCLTQGYNVELIDRKQDRLEFTFQVDGGIPEKVLKAMRRAFPRLSIQFFPRGREIIPFLPEELGDREMPPRLEERVDFELPEYWIETIKRDDAERKIRQEEYVHTRKRK